MRTEKGPDGDAQDRGGITIEQVLDEFKALKAGAGLTPQKLASAKATLALMGEAHPVTATQRLLDDLAELDNEEGRALAWALRADPQAHDGATLDSRRVKSGVPENTAKDREKRAVVWLFERWSIRRQDWATSVFTVRVSALPAFARVRYGSIALDLRVFAEPPDDVPSIVLKLDGPYPTRDFVTLASNEAEALVVYATGDLGWRLELWLPSLGEGDVRVARIHPGHRPALVRVEQSSPDGRSVEERFPGESFDGETILTMRTPNLDPPCPISWEWATPESAWRPAIEFPTHE